ncbi:MAG: FKBP-type peptidyl-prolyl cis-trans isomerase [Bacteroidales bacterium]|nr:FKBP-type peptidyl-prolyl cis-trans isomerase [Bacteroidales bacterium]
MRIRTILATAVMALALSGCTKQNLELIYNNQEDKIDKFITSLTSKQEDLRVVHNNGSHRVVLTEGEGEELKKGGRVAFYYAGYVFQSNISASNLFATNSEEVAGAAKWEITDGAFDVTTIKLGQDKILDGLQEGLVGVKAGEVCYIIFSGKHGFGKKPLGSIPPNSALAYQVWVVSISND